MIFFGLNWLSQKNPFDLLIDHLKYFLILVSKFADIFEFKVLRVFYVLVYTPYGYMQFHSAYSANAHSFILHILRLAQCKSV
jgi:hypothetical protein